MKIKETILFTGSIKSGKDGLFISYLSIIYAKKQMKKDFGLIAYIFMNKNKKKKLMNEYIKNYFKEVYGLEEYKK